MYKNTYRSETFRLQWYDYSQNVAYFVTICTNKRQHYFWDIKDGSIQLTEIWAIVDYCWFDIPNHFPFVQLWEFVIMPNHIDWIIIIERDNVETQNLVSLQKINQFWPQSWNLASIVRWFKIGVTKYVRQNTDIYDVWQRLYYEHIIRSEDDYTRISEYILNNPFNWDKDSLNT
jgi:putative transposase